MGCDIHLRVERRGDDGQWRPSEKMVPNPWKGTDEPDLVPERLYRDRNYDLFAILADVRNGRGFAGCDTGDGFTPIASPRGLPPDVSDVVKKESDDFGSDGHSHSYITLAELLGYDWTQTTTKRGFVDALAYEKWLRRSHWSHPGPGSYCGDTSAVKVTNQQLSDLIALISTRHTDRNGLLNRSTFEGELSGIRTCTQVQWQEDYALAAGRWWSHTMPRLLRLGKPDDVRIVFWFDN